jgi:hypothetical protein
MAIVLDPAQRDECMAAVSKDDVALSAAAALHVADGAARLSGEELNHELISIRARHLDGRSVWRIEYLPKDLVPGRRGGGLAVDVDAEDLTVIRVLKGQ